jgi:MFS family permease
VAIPIVDREVRPLEETTGAGGVKESGNVRRSFPRRWKAGDFALVWAGSAISTVGTRTLGVAYPLLALALTHSPIQAGWTGFALTIPILALYVPGGVLVDRIPSRSIMLAAEFLRGTVVASVFLALLLDGLTFAHLIGAALLEGALWVLYTLAETALLPSLVRRPDDMRPALAKTEAISHVASLAGRPLGGSLFGLGHLAPFALNTALFAVSWGLFFSLRREPDRRPGRTPVLRDLRVGFDELRKQPFLRSSIVLVTITNLVVNTLIMVFLAGSKGMSSMTVGLVLAAGGVGGAVGSAVAFYCRPLRSTLLVHMWIWVLALIVASVGAVRDAWPPFFALALFTTGIGGALSNVSIKAF